MSNYFWTMSDEIKLTMLFRRNKLFGLFCWLVLPATIGTYLGWVIGDLLMPDH